MTIRARKCSVDEEAKGEALVGYQEGFPNMASRLVLLKADTILLWHQ